ncbi:MAG: preprotein translocase subunit SecG [Cytophagales bacterium]
MAIIVGLAIFVSVLLVLVVLSQSSKGGISANFIGAGASQMMGVKKTSDILEKLTWGLAIALLLLTLATNFMVNDPADQVETSSPNVERANESILPSLSPTPSGGDGSSDDNLLPAEDEGNGSQEEQSSDEDDLGL